MQTVMLGRTGLPVSVVGLGCGGHSRLGMTNGADEVQASRVVAAAIDLGIDFIDTARAYGTEGAVARAIRGRRDSVGEGGRAHRRRAVAGCAAQLWSAGALRR